jgi:hypothetical protein
MSAGDECLAQRRLVMEIYSNISCEAQKMGGHILYTLTTTANQPKWVVDTA